MENVLLLNADMTPLKTVNIQRTLSLLLKEKVDVLETVPDRALRSPSISIPLPSVLRLRYYAHVPRRKATWSRRGVLERDGYTCQYCGRAMRHDEATVDHIIPQSECRIRNIRSSTWTNCVAACATCNKRKSNRSMNDAGMRFFNPGFEPKTPRTNYVIMSGNIPDSWRIYIKV